MEIEKVIRILAVFIAVACLAVCIGRRMMFPDTSLISDLPLLVALILSFGNIWREAYKKKEHKSNK